MRLRVLTREWWDKPLTNDQAFFAIAGVYMAPFLVAFLFLCGYLIWGQA